MSFRSGSVSSHPVSSQPWLYVFGTARWQVVWFITSSIPIRKIELRCNYCKDEHQSPIQAKIQCFTSSLANFPLEALTFEIKHDLLRSLHGISRSFSAASSALSAIHATREMDGARSDLMGECRVESKDDEIWKQSIKLPLILDEISFFFVSWSKLYFRTCILHSIIYIFFCLQYIISTLQVNF